MIKLMQMATSKDNCSMESLIEITHNKIIKKCEYHGILNYDEVFIGSSGYRWCLHCKNKKPSTTNILKISYTELKCKKCKILKPIDNFYKNSNPKNALCKLCDKKRKSEYRKRPDVRQKEYISEMTRFYKKKYGITFEDYDFMFKSQNGLCAICKNPSSRIDKRTNKTQRLHVDHCHVTKKVRGLLCTKCNQGIGYFNDNILLLESCVKYLHESIK